VTTRHRTLALVLTGVLLAAGCGGGGGSRSAKAAGGTPTSGTSVAADAPDGGTATITIQGSSLGAPLTVNPGEPVSVVNKDNVPYTLASGSTFTVKVPADGRTTFTAPSIPGAYPLSAAAKPAMHGTLNVRGV